MSTLLTLQFWILTGNNGGRRGNNIDGFSVVFHLHSDEVFKQLLRKALQSELLCLKYRIFSIRKGDRGGTFLLPLTSTICIEHLILIHYFP